VQFAINETSKWYGKHTVTAHKGSWGSKHKEVNIMKVQHNMQAANSNRMLGVSETAAAKSTEKLSSGYRINRAADDAAGLALSEKMRSQIRGLNQASTNAQDGISLIQTAEGAMSEQSSILQRTRELVVQAGNSAVLDTDSGDFDKIQEEINNLKEEYERINSDTEFNKKKLLSEDSTFAGDGEWLQVGANDTQGILIQIDHNAWTDITVDADTGGESSTVLADVDAMIDAVSESRSKLGAIQNRLEHTIAVDDNTSENLQSAESTIRDVDMAEEMVTYSKYNILQQAGQSMLAQANQANQGVLSLF
jgi:flagellin